MRVTVNSLAVPSCRQGGAGFYAATLIDGLSRSEGIQMNGLVSRAVAEELNSLAPQASLEIAETTEPSSSRKALNYLSAVRRPWTLNLGYSAPTTDADVVHWPISFMNGPAPMESAKKVLTVLDLQHEFFPEFFSRRDLWLRRLRWRPSARAADHLIAISEFSRQTLCERYDIPAERVTAVPLATRPTLTVPKEGSRLPRQLEGIDCWFLYPASPLPAKNHARLLDAMKILDDRGSEVTLVLTGPTMHPWGPVEQQIADRGLGDRVIRLGHVGEVELAMLYTHTTGLIFPSLFEGFGLPVLEAMGVGCPVATSSAASLPEIVGDAGRTFDPTDVEQIAGGLEWLASLSDSKRSLVADAGRRQASKFSVKRMAEDTIDVYRGVLA